MEQVTEVKSRNKINPDHAVENMIEEILNNFDFEKVQKVMNFLDWTWFSCGRPQIHHLKGTAQQLMHCAVDGVRKKCKNVNEPYFCATGGFKATAYRNVFNHLIHIQLEFIVSDWETDGD